MRLIDADKLKAELFDADWMTDNDEHMVEEIVERQKTVDAEPVRHGQWENSLDGKPFCTGCGRAFRFSEGVPNYCPNCGAYMKEVFMK